ncbi:MAG TPA: Spy/CpxP family protein refolding chaperone [Gammaproteobacteria bacterium]|nr:Spy/CpxP family protein refolding chaperone [Gammaproteobacteria bacterium]
MKSKLILTITAIIAILAVGTAFAAMGHHGPGHHQPGPFGLFSPKVVAQLHLNSAQTQSLDAIQSERKALFTQFRDQHQAMMTAFETALKSNNPDLRAQARQKDAAMDQMRDNMRKIQGDELNLYDSLTPQQKTVVRDALLKQISSMENHRDWKQGHSKPTTDSGPHTD